MAAKALPDRAKALAGKLGAALPFLKPRLPGGGSADEPFDSIEDGSSPGMDDTGPNAAPDLAAPQARLSLAMRGGEAARALLDAIIRNKLVLAILFAVLALILALCVVAIVVASPPPMGGRGSARPGPAGAVTAEGRAILHRLILPPAPGIAPHVELERELDRVYTGQDASSFLTDPGSVDITGLEARNKAEMDSLYGTVP